MPKKSDEDLIEHLRDRVGFLQSSAESYDVGNHREALRLATAARVLLHDTTQSQSLLNLLDVKLSLDFVNTGMPVPETKGSTFVGAVLAPVVMGGPSALGPEYRAQLGNAPRMESLPFHRWWKATVIGTHEGTFTREDVVRALANKDGGVHVDPKLPTKYANLRKLGVGFTFRQIAFELEATISEQLVGLLD